VSVPLVLLLVFFYSGVLELSKSFLDPFGNAGSLAQNIDTEVLVTEMNRDLPRWAATNAEVPCLTNQRGAMTRGAERVRVRVRVRVRIRVRVRVRSGV
jgi:hypothetical protein